MFIEVHQSTCDGDTNDEDVACHGTSLSILFPVPDNNTGSRGSGRIVRRGHGSRRHHLLLHRCEHGMSSLPFALALTPMADCYIKFRAGYTCVPSLPHRTVQTQIPNQNRSPDLHGRYSRFRRRPYRNLHNLVQSKQTWLRHRFHRWFRGRHYCMARHDERFEWGCNQRYDYWR